MPCDRTVSWLQGWLLGCISIGLIALVAEIVPIAMRFRRHHNWLQSGCKISAIFVMTKLFTPHRMPVKATPTSSPLLTPAQSTNNLNRLASSECHCCLLIISRFGIPVREAFVSMVCHPHNGCRQGGYADPPRSEGSAMP